MESGGDLSWGPVLALVGAVLVFGTLVYWVRVVWQLRVPRQLGPIRALLVSGGILSLAVLLMQGAGTSLALLSVGAVLAAAAFMALDRIAAMPIHAPTVAVGQMAPEFNAPTTEGESFSLESLRGRPALLKFYRGYW